MKIEYLIASPGGDLLLGPNDLRQPFLIGPSQPHPFLTLGDYFGVLRDSILGEGAAQLLDILGSLFQEPCRPLVIEHCNIRSEKHGAFYHIASLEVFLGGKSTRLALTTAIHEPARECLRQEFDLLNGLAKTVQQGSLPAVYFHTEIAWSRAGNQEKFSLMLGEWLDNYHEWHYSLAGQPEKPRVHLWDGKTGNRFLSGTASSEIFRQCARILTIYYEPVSTKQIWPWHHAAGDFIVKNDNNKIDVKLVTVRGYDGLTFLPPHAGIDPQAALLFFLLHISLWLRLDRLDGVGELFWIDNSAVEPIVKGFFDGLLAREKETGSCRGMAVGFLDLLQTFTTAELHDLCQPLLRFYSEENVAELALVTVNLEEHLRQLHTVIQPYHL